MSLLSKIRPLFTNLKDSKKWEIIRKMSDHRVFPLKPSSFQYKLFKDYLHFYALLGIIPCTLAIAYANTFIGPATLSEIPEGYTPKYWEYYRNPVTRFLAKYVFTNPQQDYEKFCAYIHIENEKRLIRILEEKIINLMEEREDYQAYNYKPVSTKYLKITKEADDLSKQLDE